MDANKLADAVIAVGYGSAQRAGDYTFYHIEPDSGTQAEPAYGAHEFVHDWRVAGALVERVTYLEMKFLANGNWRTHANIPHAKGVKEAYSPALPRAIIEACVSALSTENSGS